MFERQLSALGRTFYYTLSNWLIIILIRGSKKALFTGSSIERKMWGVNFQDKNKKSSKFETIYQKITFHNEEKHGSNTKDFGETE